MAFKIPFRLGDEVKVKSGTFEGVNIIHEIMFDGESYEYSTSRGAWISHEDCELIRPSCEETIKKLRKHLIEEGEL